MTTTITPEDITRQAKYGFTKYMPADVDRINETIVTLTALAAETDQLHQDIMAWLEKNVPYFWTLWALHSAETSALLELVQNDPNGTCNTRTGGNEAWPLSVWNKWITGHRKYQKALRAAWEVAKIERLNQADNVSWWAA